MAETSRDGDDGGGFNSLHLEMVEAHVKMSKLKIIKNVVVVSFAFTLLFTAFQSMTSLQGSLNREHNLSIGGVSIIYGAVVFSCLFLPTWLISVLGCKWTIAASMVFYILYMAAQFYATWGLVVPSSIIVGLSVAPLWSAKCAYLTQLAEWHAQITKKNKEVVINSFFGVFFMFFQTSQIWASWIFSTILATEPDMSITVDNSKCGANLCPVTYDESSTVVIERVSSKSFITCPLGVRDVGYVMMCYGATDAVFSLLFGHLVQFFGRIPFFIMAALIHLGVQITLLMWVPDPDLMFVFYLLAALWGMGDAVWQTQINALYGVLYSRNSEAAFSNYRLWESVGFIIAFVYSFFSLHSGEDIHLYRGVSFRHDRLFLF